VLQVRRLSAARWPAKPLTELTFSQRSSLLRCSPSAIATHVWGPCRLPGGAMHASGAPLAPSPPHFLLELNNSRQAHGCSTPQRCRERPSAARIRPPISVPLITGPSRLRDPSHLTADPGPLAATVRGAVALVAGAGPKVTASGAAVGMIQGRGVVGGAREHRGRRGRARDRQWRRG